MEEGKTGKRELRKRNEKIPLLNKFLVKALPLQLPLCWTRFKTIWD